MINHFEITRGSEEYNFIMNRASDAGRGIMRAPGMVMFRPQASVIITDMETGYPKEIKGDDLPDVAFFVVPKDTSKEAKELFLKIWEKDQLKGFNGEFRAPDLENTGENFGPTIGWEC